MGNLKGSTFKKQCIDALIRLDARGEKRHGKNKKDGLSHSRALYDIRRSRLKNFARYLKSIGWSGKLNKGMTYHNMYDYFIKRCEHLEPSSVNVILSTWSSLNKGLRSKNIAIDSAVDYYFFQRMKDELCGRPDHKTYKKGRYIERSRIEILCDNVPVEVKAAMLLQYELGYRASEVIAIVNNPDKYLEDSILSNVKGKGGQKYPPKRIDNEMLLELLNGGAMRLRAHTYYKKLRPLLGDNRAHDFRVSFVCNSYDALIQEGLHPKEALLKVSKTINHHRPSITQYYLNRR
jgi:hypothetical protein